jgi:hypothetical protein
VTKADIAREISDETGLTQREALVAVDSFLGAVTRGPCCETTALNYGVSGPSGRRIELPGWAGTQGQALRYRSRLAAASPSSPCGH